MAATTAGGSEGRSYRDRIAFGAWANDMRNEALPLQQWPAPQFDDTTVEGLTRTLDVIGEAGYGYLDTFGLFATDDYPPDIVSAFTDPERNRQLDRLFRAAAKRGLRLSLPLGLMTWGYDRIIREDPEVRGRDQDGNPHPHAMCGAREKSWGYIEKLLDTMLDRYDFGAAHLESADLGYCMCSECTGQHGAVGYNARLNMRAAEYIKQRRPEVLIYVCPINWKPWGLNAEGGQHKLEGDELEHVIELSRHIDAFMDQGHRGRLLRWDDVPRLHCRYGTSGGLWLYHGARMDRLSYFLPYPLRAARHLQEHHANGARACLYYQGPMVNPAVEVTSAVAGRIMCDVSRDPRATLEEVIEVYYRPKTAAAGRGLAEAYAAAEEAFFGQWDEAHIKEAQQVEMPGEFMIGALFGTLPDPAAIFTEPFFDAAGRAACRAGLRAALAQVLSLRDQFRDAERVDRTIHCLTIWLQSLLTVMLAKEEAWSG